MDAFGDNFDDNVDPAAEFLAREQNQLAGLEDELQPAVAVNATINGAPSQSDFNNAFEFVPNANHADLVDSSDFAYNMSQSQTTSNGDLESSPVFFNSADTAAPVLNGHASPHEEEELFSQPPTPAKTPPIREEPEKIKKWREAQKQRLEEKDAEEEKKKEEMRKAAKKELEEWYRHHEELIAKTKAANRNAEKQFVAEVDDIEPGTEWERIAKLCDFNPKVGRTNKDVSRMRSIILQLKQTPLKKD
ncbi:hypothetical protein M8J76_000274 [Diaphorina citri]|nr:hypothetical protein M8J76_000274 [Diaphorina citri]